jgi:hypothetical protein
MVTYGMGKLVMTIRRFHMSTEYHILDSFIILCGDCYRRLIQRYRNNGFDVKVENVGDTEITGIYDWRAVGL